MLQLLEKFKQGDSKALARCISLVENEVPGYSEILQALSFQNEAKVIGITGAPGSGKSTLTDALIGELIKQEKKVGVLCVDPSSPFNFGSLLGDRIRMSEWHNNPKVFIRSLATRGSLGGLSPKIIEITDVMKSAGFDYIIIETVGVGQSEVEIAGFADVTIVVLVPEGGDVIQTMKAGLMEVADIFVVNKSDRPDAEIFVNNLKMMLAPAFSDDKKIPILKTVASEKTGIGELIEEILKYKNRTLGENNYKMLTEKAWQLIQNKKMKEVSRKDILQKIKKLYEANQFNLYRFVEGET